MTPSALDSTSSDASTQGWQSLGSLTEHRREDDSLLLVCGSARVRITPLAGGVVRVRLAQHDSFSYDHSWAVLPQKTAASWNVTDDGDHLELTTDSLRVRIQKNPCRLSYHNRRGEELAAEDRSRGIGWDGDEVRCWMRLHDDDHFFGLGEKGCPLDKRGSALVNWNTDAAEHDPWTDPLYQTQPFLICLNGGRAYGIFFDNTWRSSFDLGKSARQSYSFGSDGGEMLYYFLPGPTPADVVQSYARLVGAPHLPPKWSLGYQQCRWSYDSAKRVSKIAREFRKRDIPCDTIYLDIDYMDGFRCFTWHPKRFAKPKALMKELSRKGFKTVVIIDPGLKAEPGYWAYDDGVAGDHFCRDEHGEIHVGHVWPGESVFPDFTRPATRCWWGDLFGDLLATGVTGIWNDMNEPADLRRDDKTLPLSVRFDNEGRPTVHRETHNVYGMQMARATFEGLRRLRESERPFVLTRAGYAGVQRYAAVWTGDNLSSWEHLRMSIPMLLNMGLSGLAFCGADIGGFRGCPSPELFTRWLQLGIFYPLCRAHTSGGPEQDPWSFGRKHEKINRRTIELRYRLLPYLYTEFQHAAKTGLPIMRPVLLDFPGAPKVHRIDHEFLFGRQLYIAPVVHEKAKVRKVSLPEGQWYDFADCRPRRGGDEIELPVDLDTIPMFARSGAIVPMQDVVQFVDDKPLERLILAIFPGPGRGWFYNDDGRSHLHERGEYTLEEYEVEENGQVTAFRLAQRRGTEGFAPGRYLLKFMGLRKAPAAVAAAGEPLPQCKCRKAFEKAGSGWWYDRKNQTVCVQLPKLSPGEAVEILRKVKSAPRAEPSASTPAALLVRP